MLLLFCCSLFKCRRPCYTQADIEENGTLSNIWHLNMGTVQSAHITEWKLAQTVIRRGWSWS